MANEIEVKISDNIIVPGANSIVLLGPNGSGKTRHANAMAGMNNANMIAALRNIALPPSVVMRSMDNARKQLQSHFDKSQASPWELSDEINELFSKLMAEDSTAAIKFRDQHTVDPTSTPDTTKLMRLSEAWARLFPGRHIEFTDYHPRVRSDYNISIGEYPAQQMSDGERVALYLAGRILDSEQKIIIIDEPEVHFHSRLASRFWTEVESLRCDCRFVYITHDLPFALSRPNAQFVIIKPNEEPQIVSLKDGIPQNLAESLLAAASFSIHAKRIVFCEGTEGTSWDQMLYSAWFNNMDTAVVPVGSGKDVVRCTTAFSDSKIVAGVESVGIIDRDYWPQRFIDSLPNSITVLAVHEIENLLCLEGVFRCVAEHIGVQPKEADSRYIEFMDKATSVFTNGLLNKQISERYKKRSEHEFNLSLNDLKATDDITLLEQQHIQAVDSNCWVTKPKDLFVEEKELLENALKNDSGEFMCYYPGKVFLKMAAKGLGMETNSYVELICNALKSKSIESLSSLGMEIENCLKAYLPTRQIEKSV